MIIQMERPSLLLMINPLSFITTTIFFILLNSPTSYGTDDEQYTRCSQLYSCGGDIREIGYPFWGGEGRPRSCGLQGFELKCHSNEYATLDIDTQSFRVLNIDKNDHIMTVARMDMWENLCPQDFVNTTSNATLFDYLPNVQNLSLFYDCSSGSSSGPDIPVRHNFTCAASGGGGGKFFLVESAPPRLPEPEQCGHNLSVPVLQEALDEFFRNQSMTLQDVLNRGFAVGYDDELGACGTCASSGGICGTDSNTSLPTCFCRNGPHLLLCPDRGRNTNRMVIIAIVISTLGTTILVACASLIFCLRKKTSSYKSIFFWRKSTMADDNVEAFLKINGSFAPKRYSYSSIKKVTNFFQDKLGQGGYGGVYKGKLLDGRLVAVKLLNETKDDNGEGFINEVASISRTCHVNIVSLLGYCFEGSKRALLYEYMPNGSLEKFLHSKKSQQTIYHLEWNTLHKIAVGVAQGLEYLHRGCTTQIFHFDIKPHNILLDEDFCPKVSDFGLAKLCPKKESIVSMLYARGTVGYIAPEVFSRHFGRVTHKADVYSYGMLLLEMVGGRENSTDEHVKDTSEIYFPHSIYKKLECDGDLGLCGIESAADEKVARKMILIGMCCIQSNPSNRPAMNKVIQMLEASLESLQIPPEPFLSAPSRSLIASSIIQISEESESCEVK